MISGETLPTNNSTGSVKWPVEGGKEGDNPSLDMERDRGKEPGKGGRPAARKGDGG